MEVPTYSDARAQFKRVLDSAIHDENEVMVTRKNGEAVVVVSFDAWSAINETLYLLSSPRMQLGYVLLYSGSMVDWDQSEP